MTDEAGGGRLVFISGMSGAGKTTQGEQLREKRGFIHVDGDVWSFSDGVATASTYSGIPRPEDLEKRSKERKETWDGFAAAYGRLFEDPENPPPMEDGWGAHLTALCEDVAAFRGAPEQKDRDIVVSFSLYTRGMRDWVRDRLPGVTMVLLDADARKLAARKAAQTVAAAEADGKTLEEFLSRFDPEKYKGYTYEKLVEAASNNYRGFQPASDGEVHVDAREAGIDDVHAALCAAIGLDSA